MRKITNLFFSIFCLLIEDSKEQEKQNQKKIKVFKSFFKILCIVLGAVFIYTLWQAFYFKSYAVREYSFANAHKDRDEFIAKVKIAISIISIIYAILIIICSVKKRNKILYGIIFGTIILLSVTSLEIAYNAENVGHYVSDNSDKYVMNMLKSRNLIDK